MLNLLIVDFHKMLKSLTFRIIGIILMAFTGLMAFIYSGILFDSAERDMFKPLNLLDGMFVSFNNLIGIICLSIIAANFICSEFSNGTFKNVVSKGYPRESVYLSKFIISIIATAIYMICMLVIYCIVSVICLIGSDESIIFHVSPHFVSCFGILFLYIAALIAVSMLFALLFKKTWIAVLIFVFAPTIINLIGMITKFQIADYFLTSNIVLLNTIDGISSNDLLRVILLPIVYLAVSLSVGLCVFRKRDI